MELLSHPSVDLARQNTVHAEHLASRQAHKLQNMPPASGLTAYQRLRAETLAQHAAEGRSTEKATRPAPKTASQNWTVVLDPFLSAKRAQRMEKLLLEAAKAEKEEKEAYQELCALGGAMRAERESLAPLSRLPRAVDKPGAGTAKQYYHAGSAKARYAALYAVIRE